MPTILLLATPPPPPPRSFIPFYGSEIAPALKSNYWKDYCNEWHYMFTGNNFNFGTKFLLAKDVYDNHSSTSVSVGSIMIRMGHCAKVGFFLLPSYFWRLYVWWEILIISLTIDVGGSENLLFLQRENIDSSHTSGTMCWIPFRRSILFFHFQMFPQHIYQNTHILWTIILW